MCRGVLHVGWCGAIVRLRAWDILGVRDSLWSAVDLSSLLEVSRVRIFPPGNQRHVAWPRRAAHLATTIVFAIAGAAGASNAAARTHDLVGVETLAMGQVHACAVVSDGAVRCWGENYLGQLGTDASLPSDSAVAVPGLSSGVDAVAVGLGHTCSLDTDGAVQCWGSNIYGELGDGTLVWHSSPAAVALPHDAVEIAAAGERSCALLDDGSVWCWGRNEQGQLGDGSTIDRLQPVAVAGLGAQAVHLSLGFAHSCALLQGGGVSCWGGNDTGQLGDGTLLDRAVARPVVGLPGPVSALSAGTSHSCVIVAAQGAWCWGWGALGQLGDGSQTTSMSQPVRVLGLVSVPESIAAGMLHSCAQFAGGSVQCWGSNSVGELGTGSSDFQSLVPVAVQGVDQAAAVVAGGQASCALLPDGRASCWGGNRSGTLGDGSHSAARLPGRVATHDTLAELSVGDRHACARTNTGDVACWGDNSQMQVGDGSGRNQFAPRRVEGLGAQVTAVDAGHAHSCVLLIGGAVQCWGSNIFGALGDATVFSSATPLTVQGLGGPMVAISSGLYFSCALSQQGGVKCWGANFSTQLGSSGDDYRAAPIDVPGLESGAIAITTGGHHACALTDAPAIRCWGANSDGQLGHGNVSVSSAPAEVVDLPATPISVHAADAHTCALLINGEAWCWGANDYSQLGDQTTTPSSRPVRVTGVPGVIARLAMGHTHSCAITTVGDAWCWGGNATGIFGDGWTGMRSIPMRIDALDNQASSIAASAGFACALMSDGTARCWGNNPRGELGAGGRNNALPAVVQEADTAHLFADGFEFDWD
jgi:alpha-tubulin suppressor-like RCC1 family protein